MFIEAAGCNPSRVIPVATVLYEPDPLLLDHLFTPLDVDGRRFYIFVNGSIDNRSEERLQSLADAVIIRSGRNVGLGAALNAVVERAAGDGFHYILLLDQDSTPSPDLPEQLLTRFQDRSTSVQPLAILGPLLVPPPGLNYKPVRYAWRPAGDGSVHFVPTSGSMISLAAWKQVGPFRADYFIDGIDVEWGFRAWSRGYSSTVATDITMVHRWGLSIDGPSANTPQIIRQSDIRTFYYVRNAVDCLRLSYVPFRWKVEKFVLLAGQIARLLQRRHFDRKTRAVIRRAIVSGLRGDLGPSG